MATLRVSAVCAWPLWSRLLSLQIGEPEIQGKGLFTDEASSPLRQPSSRAAGLTPRTRAAGRARAGSRTTTG